MYIHITHIQDFRDLFLFHVYVFLPLCICTICVSGTREGQKRVKDPLGLELPMVINHKAAAAN